MPTAVRMSLKLRFMRKVPSLDASPPKRLELTGPASYHLSTSNLCTIVFASAHSSNIDASPNPCWHDRESSFAGRVRLRDPVRKTMTAVRRAAVTIATSDKTSDISRARPPRGVRLSTPYRPFPPPNRHRHSPGRCCLRPTGSCDRPGQAQLHPCRVRPPLTRGAAPAPIVKPRRAIREQRFHSFRDKAA